MKRLLPMTVALVLLFVAGQARGQDALPAAEKLYASAQYEDALKVLDELKAAPPGSPEMALRIEQNRALCLLALDRKADAERAIEAVVDADPFYQPGEDDAAPKVREAFRDVRMRVLPLTVRQLYGLAKEAYARKAYDEAAAAFKRVLALLDEPDLSFDKSSRDDMRLVTRSFLDLLAAATAAAPPAAAPREAGSAAASGPAPPHSGSASAPIAAGSRTTGALYDESTPGVVPPLPVRQPVEIPAGFRPLVAVELIVEVIVNTAGEVESATIRQSGGGLDALVLRAARDWRYRPALKDGAPVRYRRMVKVLIQARSGP